MTKPKKNKVKKTNAYDEIDAAYKAFFAGKSKTGKTRERPGQWLKKGRIGDSIVFGSKSPS